MSVNNVTTFKQIKHKYKIYYHQSMTKIISMQLEMT